MLGVAPHKSVRESDLFHPQHLDIVGGELGELGVSWVRVWVRVWVWVWVFSLAEVFHRLSTGHKKTPPVFGGVRASVLEVFVPLPYAHRTEQS